MIQMKVLLLLILCQTEHSFNMHTSVALEQWVRLAQVLHFVRTQIKYKCISGDDVQDTIH